jgi:hypothetical protein
MEKGGYRLHRRTRRIRPDGDKVGTPSAKSAQPQYFKNIPTGCLLGACSGLQPVGFSPYSPFAFRSDEWNKHKLNIKVSKFARNFFFAIPRKGKLLRDFGLIPGGLTGLAGA